MQENTHYANLYVPVTVAALLKERPSLVSAAVQAFYYRDPVELKVGSLTPWLPESVNCLAWTDHTYTYRANIFRAYNKSAFNIMHFDVNSSHAGETAAPPDPLPPPPATKGKGFQISYFILAYNAQTCLAVSGLTLVLTPMAAM